MFHLVFKFRVFDFKVLHGLNADVFLSIYFNLLFVLLVVVLDHEYEKTKNNSAFGFF